MKLKKKDVLLRYFLPKNVTCMFLLFKFYSDVQQIILIVTAFYYTVFFHLFIFYFTSKFLKSFRDATKWDFYD